MLELTANEVAKPPVVDSSSDRTLRRKTAEFEGMLLAQVLQKLSDCYRSPDGEISDSAGESFLSLANSALGGGLAHSGGIGLGDLLATSLIRNNQVLKTIAPSADVNGEPI